MASTDITQPGTTQNVMVATAPHELPSAYVGLGVTRGYDPTPAKGLRIFIVGPSGEGKTTFVSGTDRTIILDFEKGAPGVINPRAFRVRISCHADLEKIRAQLKKDAKSPSRPFDRVVFDTVDQFAEMMNPYLAGKQREKVKTWTGTDITTWGDKGAGWAILKNNCWSIISEMGTLGYAWTVVGHITEKTIRINKVDHTVPRPVLFDSFARLIGRNCELFASIYSVIEKKDITRQIQGRPMKVGEEDVIRMYMDATTIPSEKNTGQGKLRGVPTMTAKILLPDPLTGEYGWDTFKTAYDKAVAEVREQTK